MKTESRANYKFKKMAVGFLTCFGLVLFMSASGFAGAGSPPLEKAKAIVVGDRIVDIAYNLGVLPEAMSVRGGLWPMSKKFRTASRILGCPNCVTRKNKNTIPEAMKKYGIEKLVLSKGNSPYCLYKPEIEPGDVADLVEGLNARIEYVDFSGGLKPAIRRTAAVFGKEKQGEELIRDYEKDMRRTGKFLPASPLGKKVVILSGIYQSSSGNSLLRVEAPGGYADRFILKRLGCENVGDCFKQEDKEPVKGHYMVRKTRDGFDLSPLVRADPDVIVATGDALVVQKALQAHAKENPEMNRVKAVRDMAVYALPGYIDSGVIEYPSVLRKWAVALN
jgi:ABC-type Fe3+-hydroxamate transport system substrate-binding protein